MLKVTDKQTLFHSIQAATWGETLLRPEVLERFLKPNEHPGISQTPEQIDGLTDRALELLQAASSGRTSGVIPYTLEITERIVKTPLSNFFS